MFFEFLKNLLLLNCYVYWFVGLSFVLWPVPMFIFPINANSYLNFLFNLDFNKDPSSGSGLPFLWAFVTLPTGLFLIVLGFLKYYLIKKYIF